ncbi:NADH-quinone oxidoreductase subunit N [Spirosoma utsteinense]|uniref:NADH-quinone oxidoreductase subunit N n=1 Tax=Spirosoma utsteinense TaxID=2585773 RepID=A0ABR6W188_9BACT|nr:NADH-quinone oxidoreductase subunit N [Spirosoma utsteinense]MBC3785081.1 NADH-quinone oxidoreductase subunit N [Spirosoma utsteinense]MBC3790310.1 NADH-quinone oxidoreductase subunit N [Spirosoma utsteinense]
MLPIVLLSVFGIVLLFLGFLKSKAILLPATLLFLLVAGAANFLDWNKTYLYFGDMLRTDNLTMVFTAIILGSAFLVVALSGSFIEDEEAQPAEYYGLIMFALVGAVMMVGFQNLIMLFVGVEILSVAMYVLTGSDKRNLRSNEAALKYFLMGAFTTGIMLFGMALLYGATGSFTLAGIAAYAVNPQTGLSLLLYVGLLMLLIGLLFKVSAAPFHFWTPDVYDGAPTVFTAFMSTVVKTAGFAALFRLLSISFVGVYEFWWVIMAVITAITLVIGNVTAVYQNSFKRMMAYSSISHAGYLLIGLASLGAQTKQAIVFYSLAYSVATISAFGVLLLVAQQRGTQTISREGATGESFDSFNGLARQNPLLGFAMAVSMLSLAGIPLTAGFWGKFYMFSTAVERGQIWLLVVAVLMSAIGIYYYFRVIIAMYFRDGVIEPIRVAPFYQYVLLAATILTIGLGIAPGLLQGLF